MRITKDLLSCYSVEHTEESESDYNACLNNHKHLSTDTLTPGYHVLHIVAAAMNFGKSAPSERN